MGDEAGRGPGAEIKLAPTVAAPELDTAGQAANWAVELVGRQQQAARW